MSSLNADEILDNVARSFVNPLRSPVMRDPSHVGLGYESVTFPSLDGVPLEAWFIPADSDDVVVLNHPMGFSRAGQPTHLEPWQSIWGPSGNGMEVDFLPDYAILHEAGYNVLTYDLRNFGLSGAANGGAVTSGLFEARDVVGSLRYLRARADTASMRVALFSRCLGANATFAAMRQAPEDFDEVRCLVACQPVSDLVIMGRLLEILGLGKQHLPELDHRVMLGTSLPFAARPDTSWAQYVGVPTYLYAVRQDSLTEPHDIETAFAMLDTSDKELQWVEDTRRRWDGYLEFQRRPQPVLDWLHAHMRTQL